MAGPKRRGAKQRCLVTGGAGFLGRHLVQQLVDSGRYEVTVFDIRKPEDAQEEGEVTYIIGDLRKPEDVEKACQGGSGEASAHSTSTAPCSLAV